MKKICVLGSLNIDLTISVPHFNLPGESVTGTNLAIYTGGKGGNENISEGECIRRELVAMGIDPSRIYVEDQSTSTAENVVPGAGVTVCACSVGVACPTTSGLIFASI